MQLFTRNQYQQLITNGRPENTGKDHRPVVKFFLPGVDKMIWLLTEIDNFDRSIAYGLHDLGHSMPKVGKINLKEFKDISKRYGVSVKRDDHFTAYYPLSVYVEAEDQLHYITEACNTLSCFACQATNNKICQ